MIDKKLSSEATFEDGILLKAIHPMGGMLRKYIGNRWRLRKVPPLGTVISDAALIREVLNDKGTFGENNTKTSTAYWNTLIGGDALIGEGEEARLKLQTLISEWFSIDRIAAVRDTHFQSELTDAEESLSNDEPVDVVDLIEYGAYLTLWQLIGLSEEKLGNLDFELAVKNLRAITEGLTPSTKKFSTVQIDVALGRMVFLEEAIREAYNGNRESFPLKLRDEGYSEDLAVDLTKSLLLTAAEVTITFVPRMVALFVKTRYIDYLSDHPSHLKHGIEEALRITAPIPVTTKTVLTKTSFHGIPLKVGEEVVLSTAVASKRFGDFDPFCEIDPEVQGMWFDAGVQIVLGLNLAMSLAEALGTMLAIANNEGDLAIVSQASDDKAHKGSYRELLVSYEMEGEEDDSSIADDTTDKSDSDPA